MLYLAIAGMVYAYTALDLVQGDPPADFREALAAALLCGVIALLWPPVLLWRFLLGAPRAQR